MHSQSVVFNFYWHRQLYFVKSTTSFRHYFSSKQAERKAVSRSGAHLEGDVLSLAELWIRPSDKGLAKLLLSGLSVSDSPVLSDGCCRHRSMHHTLVKAPLLHSPPFRWKSTPWSRHTYTYVLTGTLTRLAHTQTQTHTYTDTFPLWWQILPELAPICESWRGVLYESNSPVICLSQMGVQGPCLVPMIAGEFWFKPPIPTPNPQIEKCVWNVFLKLWVVRGEGSPARGVRLIIMARLGLIH